MAVTFFGHAPEFGKFETYDFGEFQIIYRFERPKKRSKRFSVHFKEGFFVFYLSSFSLLDPLSIETFVKSRKKWFKNVLDEYRSRLEAAFVISEKFEKEKVIPYLGEDIPYFVEIGKKRSATIAPGGLKITIRSSDAEESDYERMSIIKKILKGWYTEAFQEELQSIARETARRVCPEDLSESLCFGVMESVAKWGDYTKRKKCLLGEDELFVTQMIRINRQMAYYDRDLLNAVICHELAHIKHPNHGKRFYQLLEKYCPTWKKEEVRLKALSPKNDFLSL